MNECAACGTKGTTKAHVKDKSECLKEGISDHEYLNIVDLCYNCHYLLFDNRKMGISRRDSKYIFVFIDEDNSIREVYSKHTLNIKNEYITWKNRKCLPKLWKSLFKK